MRTTELGRCFGAYVVLAALGGCGDDACDRDTPNTICTIAGTGEMGLPVDGPARTTPMYIPVDTAVSPDGEVWVLDFNNYVVRAIDSNGEIRTVVGNGEPGDSPPEGVAEAPALDGPLNHMTNLTFHDGYLYLAAWHNSRIKRVRLSDMMLENVAGRGRRTYFDGDGGPALAAGLDAPSAIAFDPAGNLAIMDQQNQVIRLVDGGGTIRTIAGSCIIDINTACAAGEPPTSCPGSDKLVCGDPAMECAYPCTPGFGGDGGPALEARMAQPYGAVSGPSGRMAYDQAGNLLFTDTDNHRIRRIDTAGIITTIAGTGVRGYSGDDGPATQAQLYSPVDLAVGTDDTIYFTDVYNSCIRKIDPTGTISRVAGQCSSEREARGFAGDGGPPLDAKLDRPYGLDLVGTKLYVADSFNHRIRVIDLRSP